MLESSGSILELHAKTALSNVNILIVTNQPDNFPAISGYLYRSNIDFTYNLVDPENIVDCPSQEKYSAILYDYPLSRDDSGNEFLIEKLQRWSHLYPDIPLILITDVLGDAVAVKLIQSGVHGYVLRSELEQLPQILEQSLFVFASKQAIAKQQQDLIQQQQSEIKQLQAEIQILNHRDTKNTSKLTHQQQKLQGQHKTIQNLAAEIQLWEEEEQARQEHLAHLNHELRSPISSMLGFAGMLKEQYYGELNERQMRYIDAMVSVGQYMMDLVNNYLDIAKIDAKKQTLDLERLAVAEVCQNALFCLEKKAEKKGLVLNFELDTDVDFCTADSRCLRQILINLLSNAVKFTEVGDITLQVKHDQEWLKFAVIDTGSGISSENITKLFKPFPQISNHQESTGLGLALSRKLALLHGGDIIVTSELGKGSCFTLSIPRFHQQ